MEFFGSSFFILAKWRSAKIDKKNYFKNINLKFIDLSADFRLSNPKEYQKNYNLKHCAKKLIKKSIYSIPELNKNVN